MSTVLNAILKGYNKVYAILISVIVLGFYQLVSRNSKLKANNELLDTSIKDLNNESRKIVSIQRKQAVIAAQPNPGRDAIHDWMLDLHDTSAKP